MYIGKGLALIVAGIVGLVATIIWIVYDKRWKIVKESLLLSKRLSAGIQAVHWRWLLMLQKRKPKACLESKQQLEWG